MPQAPHEDPGRVWGWAFCLQRGVGRRKGKKAAAWLWSMWDEHTAGGTTAAQSCCCRRFNSE